MRKTRKFEFELRYNDCLSSTGQTISDLIESLREIQGEVGARHTIESVECRRERNKPLKFVVEIEEV